MRTILRPKCTRMKTSERVPCFAGSALNFGASITVNSGRCSRRFAGSFSGRNMLRANRLCHANSFTTRIGILYFGSVPPHASRTNSSLSWRYAIMSLWSASNFDSSIGLFTGPQWTCLSLAASLTTNLSFGERPVWAPVRATSGPSAASEASPRASACSYRAAGLRFQWTRPDRTIPSASRPNARSTCVVITLVTPYCVEAAVLRTARGWSPATSAQPAAPRNASRGPAVYGEDPDRTGRVGTKSTRRSGLDGRRGLKWREPAGSSGFRGIVIAALDQAVQHLLRPFDGDNQASAPRRDDRPRWSGPPHAVQGIGDRRRHQGARARRPARRRPRA